MIKETYYKDRPAVTIENEKLSATFLHLDGAKLASLKYKNIEFLAQANGEKYRRLGLDTDYVTAECSGFDDMFPTIDSCEINGMLYFDHGEVARHEHSVEISDNALKFVCKLEALNIIYNKTAFLKDDNLCIKYEIENLNSFDFPYLWAGHIMLRGEKDAKAISDFENKYEKIIMFGTPNNHANTLCEYKGNKEWKYYYNGVKSPLKCAVFYPESNYEISVEFDNDAVKYLGVWVNPGDLNDMYNIAVEPCTALYDSPKKSGDTCSYIKANKKIKFTLKFKIKEAYYK